MGWVLGIFAFILLEISLALRLIYGQVNTRQAKWTAMAVTFWVIIITALLGVFLAALMTPVNVAI